MVKATKVNSEDELLKRYITVSSCIVLNYSNISEKNLDENNGAGTL